MKIYSIDINADWTKIPIENINKRYIIQNISNANIFCIGTEKDEIPNSQYGVLLMLGDKIRVILTQEESFLWAKTGQNGRTAPLIYFQEN